MSVFLPQVIKAAPTANDARDRRWIYVPYERLTDRAGPLHAVEELERFPRPDYEPTGKR